MLKYLIVALHDNAVSFCHYPTRNHAEGKWIEAPVLADAVRFAMLENLNIQFIYPEEAVPEPLLEVIESIDHTDIVPLNHAGKDTLATADIIVADSVKALKDAEVNKNHVYALRTTLSEFIRNIDEIKEIIPRISRLNVVLTDVEGQPDDALREYGKALESLIPVIVKEYKAGNMVQINILTDRIMLDRMNNCGAGDESITLGPDGKFYVCPAYYGEEGEAVGNMTDGPEIRNKQLYRLDHAPICRICDAFQCRRCVWLNRGLTLEVNTPGHEQCVISHHERNASGKLLQELRKEIPGVLPKTEIRELDYLDPFDKIKK